MVYVDTRYDTYAYRVLARPAWVAPTDLSILDPVPGHPGLAPARRLITLITCDPAWTGAQRVIVTGGLESVTGHTAGTSANASASLPARGPRAR
jgi:sortase A